MDLPTIDYFPVSEHVVMSMLCGRNTRMICQDSHTVADSETFANTQVRNWYDSVLLGYTGDPQAQIISIKV